MKKEKALKELDIIFEDLIILNHSLNKEKAEQSNKK